jgi:hypothetical protein
MLRWQADADLCALIRRYYAGDAGLWGAIRNQVDAELRARGYHSGAYHIRLRRTADGYEVVIDDAADFAIEP